MKARRGLTLIEALAVVALLSLATGALSVSMADRSDGYRLQRSLEEISSADRRARLFARAHGPVELAFEESWVLVRTLGDEPEILAVRKLDTGVSLRVRTMDDHSVESIRIDRRGRSDDYDVMASLGETRKELHLCGLTGWVVEDQEIAR